MDPFRKRSDFKVNIKEFERNGKKLHGRFVNFWDRPELEEIPDIGKKTIANLLTKFKSAKRVKIATLEELKEVVGNARAQKIFNYYHSKK